MIRYGRGDFLPWFTAQTVRNPEFRFETLAGRILILTIFPTSKTPVIQQLVKRLADLPLLAEEGIMWFGVSGDAEDIKLEAGLYKPPHLRCFVDGSGEVLRALRAAHPESGEIIPQTLVLSPKLRFLDGQVVDDPDRHVEWLIETLTRERERARSFAERTFAPVLVMDDVFEPALCRTLIDIYKNGAPGESGFMDSEGGKTVGKIDHSFKRRKDCRIDDESIRRAMRSRISARLIPAIELAFGFRATRIERYIVACYDGADGGHFNAHRDNTTPGTAHRRFAVTINLNAEDYEGGELCFPEFGPRSYRAPTGGAVVFSCSLQHRAMPVLSGVRYCTLPFLYDDRGAEVRAASAKTIVSAHDQAKETEGEPAEPPADASVDASAKASAAE